MFLNKGFWSLWEPRTQTYNYSGTGLCNITKGHDNNDNVNNKNKNKEHHHHHHSHNHDNLGPRVGPYSFVLGLRLPDYSEV